MRFSNVSLKLRLRRRLGRLLRQERNQVESATIFKQDTYIGKRLLVSDRHFDSPQDRLDLILLTKSENLVSANKDTYVRRFKVVQNRFATVAC
jgi:hypothetical protein